MQALLLLLLHHGELTLQKATACTTVFDQLSKGLGSKQHHVPTVHRCLPGAGGACAQSQSNNHSGNSLCSAVHSLRDSSSDDGEPESSNADDCESEAEHCDRGLDFVPPESDKGILHSKQACAER